MRAAIRGWRPRAAGSRGRWSRACAEQLAALKQSGCSKDPDMGMAVADLVRGHEADLAAVRKTAAATCK